MGVVTTTTTLVLLALTVGRYECGRPVGFDVCAHVSRICTSSLMSMAQSMDPTSLDIDLACTVVDRFRNCIGSCLDSVAQGTDERVFVLAVEYMCDPSRRENVREVAAAECFRDRSLQATLRQQAQECILAAQQSIGESRMLGDITSQLCLAVDHMLECFTERLDNLCGETVAPLFTDMFQVVFGEVFGDSDFGLGSCFEQHNIVRRAVSSFFEQVRK